MNTPLASSKTTVLRYRLFKPIGIRYATLYIYLRSWLSLLQWITEQDFSDIAAAGLNHVRLPIGYWAWDVSGGSYALLSVQTLAKLSTT